MELKYSINIQYFARFLFDETCTRYEEHFVERSLILNVNLNILPYFILEKSDVLHLKKNLIFSVASKSAVTLTNNEAHIDPVYLKVLVNPVNLTN